MNILRPCLVTALLILLHSVCFGQSKRASHWYFGFESGLDFSSGVATTDITGKLNSIEGSSTMSDLAGNLLFYSNGVTVWNRNHDVMSNGNNLTGDESSTQSSLIVPVPDNNTLYYLFTTIGHGAGSGLYYSIVDMDQNGGLGSVTASKNIRIFADGTEQLSGTMHCNGKDYWIISRQSKLNTLRFCAYLLTKNGVLSGPVISEFSVPASLLNKVGTITLTQDGSLLAFSSFDTDTFVYNFDIQTGKLTLKDQITRLTGERSYSNAFSPDKQKLYISSWINGGYNFLSQYDLTAADITASRIHIDMANFRFGSPNGFGFIGQIRLAPDQKIYISRWNQELPRVNPGSFYTLDSIDVIQFPNLPGLSCQHQRNFLFLDHKPTMLGLPNFISNFTSPVSPSNTCIPDPQSFNFTFSGECRGSAIQFFYIQPPEIDAVKWDFGDPASGVNNESTLTNATHQYTQPGKYEVRLILYHRLRTDTVKKQVQAGAIDVYLGNDTLICGNTNFAITAVASGNTSFIWQDGTTNAMLNTNQSGLYWVEVQNALSGCLKRDSIQVTFNPWPNTNLGNDLIACEGQTPVLKANVQGTDYRWSNGQTGNAITVMQTGTYWLDITQSGCTKRDSVEVTFYPTPTINLGRDTTLCENESLTLHITASVSQIKWQDNSTQSQFVVKTAGSYYCTVTENGCSASDTIRINYDRKPVVSLQTGLPFCEGQTIVLQPAVENNRDVEYLWHDGSKEPVYMVKGPGMYTVQVSNHCGSTSDSAIVKKGNCEMYMPSAFTPNGDGRNDVFRPVYGDQIVKFKMIIYNRWGQKIFESNNIRNGWNGLYNGMPQPQGVYVWIIQYDTALFTNQFLKGTVTLIY